MKLYVDDIRNTYPGDKDWIIVRNYKDTITLLETGLITEIDLDNDLGEEKTGYDIVKWIEEQVITNNFTPPIIFIHTGNSIEFKNINNCKKRIDKYLKENE